MSLRHTLLLAACTCLLAAPALAQDDPFGSDPFQPGKKTNPKRSAQPGSAARIQTGALPSKESSTQKTAEERIQLALTASTTQTFIETPLVEAMQQISKSHAIPVVIDTRALEEIGLTADTPITIDLKNVSLRSLLRLMLRDNDLTYMIKDEVLQITTMEAAESNLILNMYTLPGKLGERGEEIVNAISRTVRPDTWETIGGNSSIINIDHALVVSTTSDVHTDVQSFLTQLTEKYRIE
ncbi:MAG: hypothetical protein AAFX06_17185 [Planctomycetota bacterium]